MKQIGKKIHSYYLYRKPFFPEKEKIQYHMTQIVFLKVAIPQYLILQILGKSLFLERKSLGARLQANIQPLTLEQAP